MRLTAEEKAEVIRLVINSSEGINKSLRSLGIHKRTFYNWYHAYSKDGIDGLLPKKRSSRQWNWIPDEERQLIVDLALDHTELSPRELAVKITDEQQLFVSESSVYRILKARGLIAPPAHTFIAAGDEFHTKTKFPNEMWQTDFTYFRIKGWGWYFLSTVLDDYSRYIIHHELCSNMKSQDVQRCIDRAMKRAAIGKKDAPRLLSDNGSCYIAKDLGEYLSSEQGIKHIRGKPLHPQTQGKIERYHRSIKSVVLLDNYYCPEQLVCAIDQYVRYYNTERYHESLDNLTPEDVYLGRGERIIKERQKIKENTLRKRRNRYQMEKLLDSITAN